MNLKLIEPRAVIYNQGDDEVFHVARCARVCYGRETGNDEATYNGLIKRNHLSMFRHWSVYARVYTPAYGITEIYNIINKLKCYPYVDIYAKGNYIYISTNGHFMLWALSNDIASYSFIKCNEIMIDDAFNDEDMINHVVRYTLLCDTQISTSREFNRKSPNNIAERSTRYVYEDSSICRPHWLNCKGITQHEDLVTAYDKDGNKDLIAGSYLTSCANSFNVYRSLINEGMNREDARGVLPLDTATKVIYTYSIREWRDILDLRYYGTTGKPHPNAKVLASLIRHELINDGQTFRD